MRHLGFLAFLAPGALLLACGSAGGSAVPGGAGGGAGSTGAGGAGGGGAVPMRPDPGTPPKSVQGVLVASNMQRNGAAAKTSMAGLFQMPDKDLSLPDQQAALAHYPDVALDTCTAPPMFGGGSGDQPTSLDAGTVYLTLPSGQKGTIGKMSFGPLTVYSQDLPAGSFVPGGKYVIETVGGVVSVLGDLWAPGDVTVTKPDLSSSSVLSVPRASPLDVAWTSSPDVDDVFIFLAQQGKTVVVCRVKDDGAFTVPPSALGFLQPTGGTGPGADPDQIVVEKYTWYALGGGTVLTEFHAGATIDVSYD